MKKTIISFYSLNKTIKFIRLQLDVLLYEKSVPMTQPEGITFTSDVKRMYVAGEPKEGGYFRLNENLVNTYELLRQYTGFLWKSTISVKLI